MTNLEQLRLCVLAECKEMQTVVDGRQLNRGNDIFSHLLYLYVSHMKSLRSIWEGPKPPCCFFGMLKSLVLQNCPELTTVFSLDFLGNLSLLKELLVKDCPKVTTLISDGSFKHKGEVFLPKLRKIMLLHLPELITLSNGCYIAPSLNNMAIYDCPKLQSLSKSQLSSQTLKVIRGEIKWWEQLQWNKEEWGISQRPSQFDRMFSLIDNHVDIMTQFGNDGDDIDDDADMTPPQFSFEHPKQNADRVAFTMSSKISELEDSTLDDGYKWRKYGKKTMAGSKNSRACLRELMETSRAEGKRSSRYKKEEEEEEEEEDEEETESELGSGKDDVRKGRVISNTYSKRGPKSGSSPVPLCCQADGCHADLSDAKQYHRRHRVCEHHAKAKIVFISGREQRFCQQCSRFHKLSEFDNSKRSCRRRLAGHTGRRRKYLCG